MKLKRTITIALISLMSLFSVFQLMADNYRELPDWPFGTNEPSGGYIFGNCEEDFRIHSASYVNMILQRLLDLETMLGITNGTWSPAAIKNFMTIGFNQFTDEDPIAQNFIYNNMIYPGGISVHGYPGGSTQDGYLVIDKFNLSGKEDGSDEYPFTSFQTAIKYGLKRWNHCFFRIMRHAPGDYVIYGGVATNIPNDEVAYGPMNTYKITYPDNVVQIGLTSQSIHLYSQNYVQSDYARAYEYPLRIMFNTGNANKNDREIRGYVSYFHIGDAITYGHRLNGIIDIGFEDPDNPGQWLPANKEWSWSMHGGSIRFTNVRFRGGQFALRGDNFKWEFNYTPEFNVTGNQNYVATGRISTNSYPACSGYITNTTWAVDANHGMSGTMRISTLLQSQH